MAQGPVTRDAYRKIIIIIKKKQAMHPKRASHLEVVGGIGTRLLSEAIFRFILMSDG